MARQTPQDEMTVVGTERPFAPRQILACWAPHLLPLSRLNGHRAIGRKHDMAALKMPSILAIQEADWCQEGAIHPPNFHPNR